MIYCMRTRVFIDNVNFRLIESIHQDSAPSHLCEQHLLQVFEEVYELALDEDVNRVIFALPRESPMPKDNLAVDLRNATLRLRKLGDDFAPWKNGPNLEDFREGKIRLVPRT